MPAGVSPLIVMTLTGEPRTFTSCDEWPGALEQTCCREDAKHREHECKLRRDTEQDSDPGSGNQRDWPPRDFFLRCIRPGRHLRKGRISDRVPQRRARAASRAPRPRWLGRSAPSRFAPNALAAKSTA